MTPNLIMLAMLPSIENGKNMRLLALPRDLQKRRFYKEKKKMKVRRCVSAPLQHIIHISGSTTTSNVESRATTTQSVPRLEQESSLSPDRWGRSTRTQPPVVPVHHDHSDQGTPAPPPLRRPGFEEDACRRKDFRIRIPRRQRSFDNTGPSEKRVTPLNPRKMHSEQEEPPQCLAVSDGLRISESGHQIRQEQVSVIRSRSHIDNIGELREEILELEKEDEPSESSSSSAPIGENISNSDVRVAKEA